MKTMKFIVKVLVVFLAAGLIFYSCDTNSGSGMGTLIINLPGDSSARAVDLAALAYQIDCVRSGYDTESITAGSGQRVSIALAVGSWSVTVTVIDADGNNIGEQTKTVDIKTGENDIDFLIVVDDSDDNREPVDDPPVDNPPVDDPPVDNPPVDDPPVVDPPVDDPPVVDPPVDDPPVDNPPVDDPGDNRAPEDKPFAERWDVFHREEAVATVSISVDDDVCAITVGGIAQPNDESDDFGIWKVHADYAYTAQANTSYIYQFEAWTAPGTGSRNITFQYYYDIVDGKETYISLDLKNRNNDGLLTRRQQTITETRTTFTVIGERLPKGGVRLLEFQCGDKLGTYYVSNISITPNTNPFTGTWTGYLDGQLMRLVIGESSWDIFFTEDIEWPVYWYQPVASGTYSRNGNNATLSNNNARDDYQARSATVSGNTMTVIFGNDTSMTLVYGPNPVPNPGPNPNPNPTKKE